MEDINARNKPMITVLNKIDIAPDDVVKEISVRVPNPVMVSAINGDGIDGLLEKITDVLTPHLPYNKIVIPYDNLSMLNDIYSKGKVVKREDREDGIYLEGWFDI